MNTTTKIDLRECTGTERYYFHPIGGYLYTEGIQALANGAECYWVLDAIGSYQPIIDKEKHPFQVWTLEKSGDGARLSMRDDDNAPELVHQDIEYTDFPFGMFLHSCASWTDTSVTLWLLDGVLLLPSEY